MSRQSPSRSAQPPPPFVYAPLKSEPALYREVTPLAYALEKGAGAGAVRQPGYQGPPAPPTGRSDAFAPPAANAYSARAPAQFASAASPSKPPSAEFNFTPAFQTPSFGEQAPKGGFPAMDFRKPADVLKKMKAGDKSRALDSVQGPQAALSKPFVAPKTLPISSPDVPPPVRTQATLPDYQGACAADLSANNVQELREMARKAGVAGFSKMRKRELCTALASKYPGSSGGPSLAVRDELAVITAAFMELCGYYYRHHVSVEIYHFPNLPLRPVLLLQGRPAGMPAEMKPAVAVFQCNGQCLLVEMGGKIMGAEQNIPPLDRFEWESLDAAHFGYQMDGILDHPANYAQLMRLGPDLLPFLTEDGGYQMPAQLLELVRMGLPYTQEAASAILQTKALLEGALPGLMSRYPNLERLSLDEKQGLVLIEYLRHTGHYEPMLAALSDLGRAAHRKYFDLGRYYLALQMLRPSGVLEFSRYHATPRELQGRAVDADTLRLYRSRTPATERLAPPAAGEVPNVRPLGQ